MYIIHEGEVLLKEKYGSSLKERFYVKPQAQSNVVILDEDKRHDVAGWFTKVFLPQGYPDSVSKDYISYQIWDTAQAFCSTITGTLATQEVLRGVGVGNTSATPLAATVTWVIKDGCGHIGKILFAYSHGTYLDAYSKKWRLYADILNDAAMCIEIALPLFKYYTLFALCVSTMMKAIVGVAGGATRAAMTQHHAVRGNLADVSAKDSAQETAVNLIASITALFIITIFGNSLFIFGIMIMLHIIFNYMAVRAVCLRTLNEPRFLQVIDKYLRHEVIDNPCEINSIEPLIFYNLGPNLLDLKLCGFQIKLGHSLKKILRNSPKATNLSNIRGVYEDRFYILFPDIGNRKMYIMIKDEFDVNDLMCGYLHAVLLSIIVCALNNEPLAVYQNSASSRPFAQVCRTLQAAAWSREPADVVGFSGFQHEPSIELMKYVDKIVQNEWRRIRNGLVQTGWDLNKHLLMVDEWRISSHKIEADAIRVSHDYDISDNLIRAHQNLSKVTFVDFVDKIPTTDYVDQDTFTIEPDSEEDIIKEWKGSSDLKIKSSIDTISEYKDTREIKSKDSQLNIDQSRDLRDTSDIKEQGQSNLGGRMMSDIRARSAQLNLESRELSEVDGRETSDIKAKSAQLRIESKESTNFNANSESSKELKKPTKSEEDKQD